MKNLFFVFLFTISGTGYLGAQAYTGKVTYQKKEEDALVIEYPFTSSVVEDAIAKEMGKRGFKRKESKGFLVYNDVVIREISSGAMDYMIKVDKKSRKEKEESVVYLIMSQPDGNALSIHTDDLISNGRSFLNSLSPKVEAYNLEQEILAQEDAVSKEEKKLKKIEDDYDDLQKRLRKLQDDMADNQKDQEKQKRELENQQHILAALKGKKGK